MNKKNVKIKTEKNKKRFTAIKKQVFWESQEINVQTPNSKSKINAKLKYFLVCISILILLFISYLLINRPQDISKNEAVNEREQLMAELRAIVLIPTDETPEIATIYNSEDYSDIYFFARAQNGDKVIGYIQAKFAILYRPSTKQIVWMGPLTSTNQNGTVPAVTESP